MSCFFGTFGGSVCFLRLKNGKHMMARNLVGESSWMSQEVRIKGEVGLVDEITLINIPFISR